MPNTKRVDARALVARLGRQEEALRERVILAPLLPGGRIRTRLAGLVCEFKPRERFSGWGHFRPLDEREAEYIGEPQPWERGAYLELFPLLRVILLWPDPNPRHAGAWWAIPFNESDARQRFGLGGEPLPVLLCDPTDGADRFERVLARVDGRTLWYDGPDPLADPTHAEWLRDAATAAEIPDRFPAGLPGSARLALLQWQMRQVELAMRAARPTPEQPRYDMDDDWMDAGMLPEHPPLTLGGDSALERRLRRALAKADATLHGFSEVPGRDGRPGTLVVEWSERGQRYRYRSLLDRNLSVVSSGICLSGRDRDFDLTSLVSVMVER